MCEKYKVRYIYLYICIKKKFVKNERKNERKNEYKQSTKISESECVEIASTSRECTGMRLNYCSLH